MQKCELFCHLSIIALKDNDLIIYSHRVLAPKIRFSPGKVRFMTLGSVQVLYKHVMGEGSEGNAYIAYVVRGEGGSRGNMLILIV